MSSEPRPSKLNRLFRHNGFRWLLILIVLMLVSWFAYHKGQAFWEELKKQWAQAHLNFEDFGYSWFILGVVVFLASVVSTFIRWRILLHALHIKCSYSDAIRLGFVGYVGSVFMPGSITGDVIKAGFIYKENPGNRVGGLSSIVVDRLVGLYSLFLLAAFVGLFNLNTILSNENEQAGKLKLAYYAICIFAAAGIVVYGLFLVIPFEGKGYGARIARIRFIGGPVTKILRAFTQYRRYPWAMVKAVVFGMLGHIGFVLSYYFASKALPGPGPTPDWQLHFLIIPFFMVFQALPLTPGGNLGVGDLVLGVLYTFVGGLELKGVLASLFQRLMSWIVALIGLIWYIPLHRRNASELPSRSGTVNEIPAPLDQPAVQQPIQSAPSMVGPATTPLVTPAGAPVTQKGQILPVDVKPLEKIETPEVTVPVVPAAETPASAVPVKEVAAPEASVAEIPKQNELPVPAKPPANQTDQIVSVDVKPAEKLPTKDELPAPSAPPVHQT